MYLDSFAELWVHWQVAEKHGSLKVVVYEGLKWQHRQAQEDSRQTKKSPPNRNKAAVSVVLVTDVVAADTCVLRHADLRAMFTQP